MELLLNTRRKSHRLANTRKMRQTPFQHQPLRLLEQKKGAFLMAHHIVERQPSSCGPSVSEQMVSLLSQLLTLAQSQQDPGTKRGRGRPPSFSLEHLWLAVLVGMLTQVEGLRRIWRGMVSGPLGSFPMLAVTYEAVRSRLLAAGSAPLQHFFVQMREALRLWAQQQQLSAWPLASFAPEVVALDETSLDELKRLTADLREVPDKDAHLRPGKLAGLFDLRHQQWLGLQLRAQVP